MHIRSVTSEQLPILAELARATFIETFGYLYPPEDLAVYLDKSYAESALETAIADPAQIWRIVFDDAGRAVAYLQCGPVHLPHPEADPAHEGELKRLYIHSDFQGHGLGRRLLGVALDLIFERYGPAAQWIGVWSENYKAQALYRSVGFEKVGDYQFSVGNTRDDEFILRRPARS